MHFLVGSFAVMAATVSGLPQPVMQGPAPAGGSLMTPQQAAAQAKMSLTGTSFAAQTNKLLTVVVGGPQLSFTPNSVMAGVGDVVQFQFSSGNHTVTQSSETFPCQPIQIPGAVSSGHLAFAAGQPAVSTFNMPVTSTDPMFIYCATGPHCQLGMVMMINPTSPDQVVNYAANSAAAPPSGEGKGITGGTIAQIPVAAAAFKPAAAPAAPGAPGAPAAPAAPNSPATTPPSATTAVTGPGSTSTEVIIIIPADTSAPAGPAPTAPAPSVTEPAGGPPAESPASPPADPPAGPPNFPANSNP